MFYLKLRIFPLYFILFELVFQVHKIVSLFFIILYVFCHIRFELRLINLAEDGKSKNCRLSSMTFDFYWVAYL